MKIEKEISGTVLTCKLFGKLDTRTAPLLQEVVDTKLCGVTKMIVDMESLEYVSSAGLRVLLSASKKMHAVEGCIVVRNPNDDIQQVFKITGFNKVLILE